MLADEPAPWPLLVAARTDTAARRQVLARLSRGELRLGTLPADLYMWFGFPDSALVELERLAAARNRELPNIIGDSTYRSLRDNPRFQTILRGMRAIP